MEKLRLPTNSDEAIHGDIKRTGTQHMVVSVVAVGRWSRSTKLTYVGPG